MTYPWATGRVATGRASERIIALVSGLPTERRHRRQFVVLQAYIDNSFDRHCYVLAGYIAPVDAWLAFSDEWQRELDADPPLESFKMSQLARTEAGMLRAGLFYKIIEKHVTAAVSVMIDSDDLVKVTRGLYVPAGTTGMDKLENPYYFAFGAILKGLPQAQEQLGLFEPVDFIFDDQTEKANLVDAWDAMQAGQPLVIRRYFGAMPRFEKDHDFLPLQAADLLAWWVRRWHGEGNYDALRDPPFPWEKTREHLPHAHFTYNEDEVRRDLEATFSDPAAHFRAQLPAEVLRQIADARMYDEELSDARAQMSCLARLREFLARFRQK